MAAAAWTEDNNSREGRIAVHEAGANRIIANGRPVTDIIDPKYYPGDERPGAAAQVRCRAEADADRSAVPRPAARRDR